MNAHQILSRTYHVAVLMGGWANERPVSLMSGEGVAKALEARGHRVIPSVRTISDLRKRALYGLDVEDLNQKLTHFLPAGGQANPMIYEQNGRQYLVIMAGGHHFMETPRGDYVIAYALPEKK